MDVEMLLFRDMSKTYIAPVCMPPIVAAPDPKIISMFILLYTFICVGRGDPAVSEVPVNDHDPRVKNLSASILNRSLFVKFIGAS